MRGRPAAAPLHLFNADTARPPDSLTDPGYSPAAPSATQSAPPFASPGSAAGPGGAPPAAPDGGSSLTLPDAVTGACAVLDCAADLPPLCDAVPKGWRALLRSVRDALAPAVLADPIGPTPPLSPGRPPPGGGQLEMLASRGGGLAAAWWTHAHEGTWVRRRADGLRHCTSWRAVCHFSSRRDELLGAAAARDKARARGGVVHVVGQGHQQHLIQSTVQHWEHFVLGVVLRTWRGYTRAQSRHREVRVLRFGGRRDRLLLSCV
eukprot:gene14938-60185_t